MVSYLKILLYRRPATLDYGWREFKWYMIYAWGCPTVLTICMAIVNFHPGHHQKPGIGLNHCWFFSKFSFMSMFTGRYKAPRYVKSL